ncbi:MAG: hypothetical protein JXR64_12045 [Spirochaetales bacterium]|nr:hypothetical protein [Spirochaetales bacterium]
MSIKSLLELSINSINNYRKLIENNKSKDFGSEIISAYNILGENIESLTLEIEEIFSSDKLYEKHFENDDIQDFISDQLNDAFDLYEDLIKSGNCEEKVALAYEWLFEVMLFTTDDEHIKSRITLNKNGITLQDNLGKNIPNINEKSKVMVKVESGKEIEEIYLAVEEIVDDYLYCYIGDKNDENDLIIFPIEKVFKVK